MLKLLVLAVTSAFVGAIPLIAPPAADGAPVPAPTADVNDDPGQPGPVRQAAVPGDPDEIDRPAVSLHPVVTVVGADDASTAALDDALVRFRTAGLPLPDVEVVFHGPADDMAGCKGHFGLFQPQYEPWRILVCSDLDFVITHELAHAWERANLDDRDREAYSRSRGFAAWDHAPDAEWRDRPVEDAAFVMQQNLMARSADPANDRWADLLDAYESLTGRPSPALAGHDGIGRFAGDHPDDSSPISSAWSRPGRRHR